MADAAAALAWLSERYATGPLFAGGFSFGSYVGLRAAVAEPRVHALVALAPPIELYDFSFLVDDARPILCLAGDRDPICPAPQLEDFVGRLGPRATLVRVPGAAHLLTTHLQELHDAVVRFVAGCL
jgi:alpha/beta superfamily hydrolase